MRARDLVSLSCKSKETCHPNTSPCLRPGVSVHLLATILACNSEDRTLCVIFTP